MRKTYTSKYKAKVAVEAIKEDQTMAELSSNLGVHRAQIQRWKKEALDGIPTLFGKDIKKSAAKDKTLIAELYRQIGPLKVENDFLKKTD